VGVGAAAVAAAAAGELVLSPHSCEGTSSRWRPTPPPAAACLHRERGGAGGERGKVSCDVQTRVREVVRAGGRARAREVHVRYLFTVVLVELERCWWSFRGAGGGQHDCTTMESAMGCACGVSQVEMKRESYIQRVLGAPWTVGVVLLLVRGGGSGKTLT
jgi:hypothetical protein